MGTRGALGYQMGGDIKASYNHFDSYPENGLGEETYKFVKELLLSNKMEDFKEKLLKIKWVLNSDPMPHDLVDKYRKYFDTVSTSEVTEWYALLRKVQGIASFEAINNGELEHLIESTGFLLDSLFCEYAYTINFDDNTLDVWQGYQAHKVGKGYGACIRTASIPFDDILTHESIMDFMPKDESDE